MPDYDEILQSDCCRDQRTQKVAAYGREHKQSMLSHEQGPASSRGKIAEG